MNLNAETAAELTAAEIREIRLSYRDEAGNPLSYRHFAKRIGVSWQAVQSWELGLRKPGAVTVRVLSEMRRNQRSESRN